MSYIVEFGSVKAIKHNDKLILDFKDTPKHLSFHYDHRFISKIREKYFSKSNTFKIDVINAELMYLSIVYPDCQLFVIVNSKINQLFLSISDGLMIYRSTIALLTIQGIYKSYRYYRSSYISLSDSTISFIEYEHHNTFNLTLDDSCISNIHMKSSVIDMSILKRIHPFKEIYAYILSSNIPINPPNKSFNIPNSKVLFNISNTIKSYEYLSNTVISYLLGQSI